jgi:hypothetical protein
VIAIGDLVVVVKGGCDDGNVGYIFRVGKIWRGAVGGYCPRCMTDHGYPDDVLLAAESNRRQTGFVELPRLKRIKPLDELERDQIVKELSV